MVGIFFASDCGDPVGRKKKLAAAFDAHFISRPLNGSICVGDSGRTAGGMQQPAAAAGWSESDERAKGLPFPLLAASDSDPSRRRSCTCCFPPSHACSKHSSYLTLISNSSRSQTEGKTAFPLFFSIAVCSPVYWFQNSPFPRVVPVWNTSLHPNSQTTSRQCVSVTGRSSCRLIAKRQ